jgi:hypothetical protein
MNKGIETGKYNFDNLFSRTLNWASLLIIVVSLSGLVWIISYLTLHEIKPIKNEVNIITNIPKNDTVTRISWDSYLQKIDSKVTQLQDVETNLNKKIDEINTFYKFLGTILAIIIAITGFFGFKSLHELKIRNLENAKDVAKNEAILKVESELQNLKEKTTSKIDEAKSESKLTLLSEYYKMVTRIEAISGNIEEINSRLDVVENLERDFEDHELRLQVLENQSFNRDEKPSDEKTTSHSKSTKGQSKKSIVVQKDVLSDDDEFGEEGFDSGNK